jgi:hypothetical protein
VSKITPISVEVSTTGPSRYIAGVMTDRIASWLARVIGTTAVLAAGCHQGRSEAPGTTATPRSFPTPSIEAGPLPSGLTLVRWRMEGDALVADASNSAASEARITVAPFVGTASVGYPIDATVPARTRGPARVAFAIPRGTGRVEVRVRAAGGAMAVAAVEAFAKRACACTKADCAAAVQAEFMQFIADHSDEKGSEAHKKKVEGATERMSKCIAARQDETPAPTRAAQAETPASSPAAIVEPTAAEKAVAEKAVVMLEEMARVAAQNATRCDRAATAMQRIVDRNRDLIAAGKELDKDPEKKAWFEQSYQGRMTASIGKMVPLMEKCRDHAGLLRVFDSMK